MAKKVSNCEKICLLLWKNFTLLCNDQARCLLLCELLLPIATCGLIVSIYAFKLPVKQPALTFSPNQLEMGNWAALLDKASDSTKVLAYSPKNQIIDAIINETLKLGNVPPTDVEGFPNSKVLRRVALAKNFAAAIQFADHYFQLTEYPQKFAFTLRFPSVLQRAEKFESWHTNELYPTEVAFGPRNPGATFTDGRPIGYFDEGFLSLQHALTMSFIKLASKQHNLPNVSLNRLPYPAFVQDSTKDAMDDILALILVICFLSASFNVTRYVALEKENGIKEILKMSGVPDWIQWTASFLRALIVWGIICIFLTLMFKLPLKDDFSFFMYTDGYIIYLFLLLYTIAVICFSFMMTVCFSKAITAIGVTAVTFLISYAPIALVMSNYASINLIGKLLLCLNLNFALPLGIRAIIQREALGEGVQWCNLFEKLNEEDELALGYILGMLLLAAFLYMLVCLYLEQLNPGAYGVPRKWYFLCKRSFWCGENEEAKMHRKASKMQKINELANPLAFEEEPKMVEPIVELRTLGKSFQGDWVVRKVTLKLFKNEIVVLLGPNGAGKSMLMSMLTGMTAPTVGTAIINGYDIRHELSDARKSVGYCPQQNILFDDMTALSHLILFSRLRGLRGKQLKTEVDKYLKRLQLKEKANVCSYKLPDSIKRKLALACALCGGTEVVFCDAPSAGLDVVERRQLWDLLQVDKMGRTLLLTTQFLDEAEVLGDRIAFMCQGELKCHGSAFFLKKLFGLGYVLTLIKSTNYNIQGLTRLLRQYIPGIMPERDIGTQLTYQVPAKYANLMVVILEDLQETLNDFGFQELCLRTISLEDVFLKFNSENVEPDAVLNILTGRSDRERFSIDTWRSVGGQDENTDENDNKANEKSSKTNLSQSVYYSAYELPKLRREEEIAEEVPSAHTLRDSQRSEPKRRSSLKSVTIEPAITITTITANKSTMTEPVQIYSPTALVEEKKSFSDVNEAEAQKPVDLVEKFLTPHHWRAMWYKKIIYTRRNLINVLLQNLATILFIVLAMLAAGSFWLNDQPPMTYRLKQYSKAVTLLAAVPTIPSANIKEPKNVTTDSSAAKSDNSTSYPVAAEPTIPMAKPNPVTKKSSSVPTNEDSDASTVKSDNSTSTAASSKNNSDASNVKPSDVETTPEAGTTTANSDDVKSAPIKPTLEESTTAKKEIEFNNRKIRDANTNPTKNTKSNSTLAEEYAKLTNLNAADNYMVELIENSSLENYALNLAQHKAISYIKTHLVGATITEAHIFGWYNNQPWHTSPLALNLVHNAIARHLISPETEITVTNHPLPYTSKNDRMMEYKKFTDEFVVLLIGLGMTFALAFYAVFPIKENVSQFKLLQFVSGVKSWKFWLTHFIWDFTTLIITSILIIVIIRLFNLPQYSSFEILAHYFLLLLVFCFAALPLTYVLAGAFKMPMSGFALITIIYFFTGIVLVSIYIILKRLAKFEIKSTLDYFLYALALVPHFSLMMGWMSLDETNKMKLHCKIVNEKYFDECHKSLNYYDCGDGKNCIYYFGMLITGVVLLVYLILRDLNGGMAICSAGIKTKDNTGERIDVDVRTEKQRILVMSNDEIVKYHLVLDRLKSCGRPKPVNGVSLSVRGQQCFSLLGNNGAGKTTVFSMLIGYKCISSGKAYVMGRSVRKQLAAVRKRIGYCPQTNPLFEEFTARNMFVIISLLRGEQKERITEVSERLAKMFGFSRQFEEPIKIYSAGHKRQLSTALAFVGAPSVILLDEPTKDVDLASQQKLWQMICNARDSGKSIIFTTHNTIEAEILCSKLAIMADGKLTAIGSMEHLRKKHSKGFILKIQAERQFGRPRVPLQKTYFRLKSKVIERYSNGKFISEYEGQLTFLIPFVNNLKWSEVFTWIEENRSALQIESFSISQTNLEEIILDFSSVMP